MMEPARAGDSTPRAFLRVGGANLARHQLSLVLAAGCERVVCVARDFGPDLIALQHEAERGGARFQVIAGARGLTGLVTAADEVLVMAEGLLPITGDALRLLDGPPAVLVQPAEAGIPAGYERIDLNHASAGLMFLPGRLVDRLTELPADADPASALLRIALQAGVTQRSVPDEVRLGGRWLMVRTEDEADHAEESWMARHTSGGGATPGSLLARLLVRQFGPALLHDGSGANGLAITAMVLAFVGFAAAWFGYVVLGLGFAGVGWVIGRAAALLARIQRETLSLRSNYPFRQLVFDGLFDTLLVAMLVLALPALPGELLVQRCFAPVVLIGLVRLLPRGFAAAWTVWAEDRLVLVLVLAVLVLGQVLEPGLPALVAALLLAGLVLPRDKSAAIAPQSAADRLTRA